MNTYIKRLLLNKLRSKRRLTRMPSLAPPTAAVRQYQAALLQMLARAREAVEAKIKHTLPALLQQAEMGKPDASKPKQDAWGDDLHNAMLGAKDNFTREYTDDEISRMANKYGLTVEEFNRIAMQRGFARVVGVDLFGSDLWLSDELEAFAAENVALITSMSDAYFADAEKTIFDGFRQGLRYEEIQKGLLERFSVSESKARLIARDQVGKLNGQLSKLRQTDLGITGYIWRTSRDERVRGDPEGLYPNADPSHYAREGEKFSWDDPPEDGHPGQPIQCRCWAEPDFSTVLDNTEEES